MLREIFYERRNQIFIRLIIKPFLNIFAGIKNMSASEANCRHIDFSFGTVPVDRPESE